MTTTTVACPNGHQSPENQHFCGECGALLVASQPPADLYPDPDGCGDERYWDGQHWMKYRRPQAPPLPTQHTPGSPAGNQSASWGEFQKGSARHTMKYGCCPALKMTMMPSLFMKTGMVVLVGTLTGSSSWWGHPRHDDGRAWAW